MGMVMFTIKDTVELEITECIAEGGMGAVYKAKQKGAGRFEKTVAVKTLLASLAADKKFVEMFKSEALLVANLIHENIVQIYQLGLYQDKYYFLLEYVDGISLHEFMRFHRKLKIKLPLNLAVFIISRIARGLAYAHSRTGSDGAPLNIVHCDICPSNILINSEGLPKLTDFGIARAATVVSDGAVSGKIPYMSPEQAGGGKLDFRSDIYSLGIILFSLLAHKHPRNIDSSFKALLKEARSNIIKWDTLPERIKTDSMLMDILHKMLASKPSDRYQATNQLAKDLEYYIYKDGYGPTIVTLAEYMRKNLPYAGSENRDVVRPGDKTTLLVDKTTRINLD
jgi:serine/threonine protein kinase